MAYKYKANLGREKVEPGKPRAVIGFKDSKGGRWEFDGALPAAAVHTIMVLAATGGKRTSRNVGADDGIAEAFALAAKNGEGES